MSNLRLRYLEAEHCLDYQLLFYVGFHRLNHILQNILRQIVRHYKTRMI
nr:MAG TPA: hypothetical protein [Caudoviricetes sp.]